MNTLSHTHTDGSLVPMMICPGNYSLVVRGHEKHASAWTVASVHGLARDDANAARLAACWNACLGLAIPDDLPAGALATLVDAARNAEKMLSGLFREIDLPGDWETGTGNSIDAMRAALAPFTAAPDPAPVSPPVLIPFGDGTWYRCDRPELFGALESLGFRRSGEAVEANVMSGIPAKAVAAGLVAFPETAP